MDLSVGHPLFQFNVCEASVFLSSTCQQLSQIAARECVILLMNQTHPDVKSTPIGSSS